MGVRCFVVVKVERENDAPLWMREDTSEVLGVARDLPPGAVWEAPWMPDRLRVNGDGPVLVVKLPDGREWLPGSQAANCTRPGEDHDCWCVHGEAPELTVDKVPEPGRSTCDAGAGSIGPADGDDARRWHGFLTAGELREV